MRRFFIIILFLKQKIPETKRMRAPHPTGTAMLIVRPIELVAIAERQVKSNLKRLLNGQWMTV